MINHHAIHAVVNISCFKQLGSFTGDFSLNVVVMLLGVVMQHGADVSRDNIR